jgi:hypothetical protein
VKAALHPGAKYVQLKLVRLVGMMLIVYVKDHLRKLIKHETAEWCGTGLLGKMVINGATGNFLLPLIMNIYSQFML